MTSTINVERKPWEEIYFHCPVYHIELNIDYGPYSRQYMDAHQLVFNWECTLPFEKNYQYIWVDSKDIPVIASLETYGFRHLVTTVELEKKIEKFEWSKPMVRIGILVKKDIPYLEKLGGESFIYGRLPAESHNIDSYALHAEWVRNCCNGKQADVVLVAYDILDIPIGFIALKKKNDNCNIVLIAVESEYRGGGIGTALLEEANNVARSNNLYKMTVRTELPSIAALNMYQKNGFRITGGGVYLGRYG
jgi:ribosomal protein S18 acetylase RimI-like enzyme